MNNGQRFAQVIHKRSIQIFEAQHDTSLAGPSDAALKAFHKVRSRFLITRLIKDIIAHDLNNIFNVISIAAEEGSRACGDEGVQTFLKPLRSSAQRGTEMVGRLLSYSRSVPTEPIPLDMGARIEENLDFFRRAGGRGCFLELRGQKVPSRVLIDPVGFDQVVLNLVVNASQAMADGGRILLDLRTEALATPRTVGIEQVRPGFWQVLSVTDQGPGIDPGEAERIFEPFYTTRAGTGTGLGLATVLSVVQEAGGAVEVAPGPEGGTRFSCWFPLLTEEEAARGSRS